MVGSASPVGRAKPFGLETAVPILLWIAAIASVALTLFAGRHNPSALLVAMFVLWVAAPFVGFFYALRLASRTPTDIAAGIRASVAVMAVGSVLVYALAAALPLQHAAAFPFLVVPGVSWVALGCLLLSARLANRRR